MSKIAFTDAGLDEIKDWEDIIFMYYDCGRVVG
jgi:hypothetical protein